MLREITFDSKKVPAFLDGAINAMALYKQTGIINKFDKCTVTAPIDYTTTGYGTITFNDGAIVICGRIIYIEAGTTLAIPITTTAGGSIGVKVDLNQNAGSQVTFYSKTTQTLTQQDLNENKTVGIYEFEIFKYTSNGIILTLTYQTASVFDTNEDVVADIVAGTLQVGSSKNADNATNAIKNNDESFSAFTTDSNGVLKVDNTTTISQKSANLISSPVALTQQGNAVYTSASSILGKIFEIEIGGANGCGMPRQFIKIRIDASSQSYQNKRIFFPFYYTMSASLIQFVEYLSNGTNNKLYLSANTENELYVYSVKEIIE